MKNTKTITILCLLASVMIAPFAIAESATVLLKQGIYVEETEGDLDKAIAIYKQVLNQAAKVQRLASRATFQLGMCHLKKGEKETAAKYFQQVVSKYPTQKTLVKKAQRELSKLPPTEDVTSKSYVIHYKAIDQSKDALELLNQNYPKGVRTYHANQYRKNGKTINSIRTDNETGKDKIVAAINDSDELELVKVDSPTANSMPIVTATSPSVYANDVSPSLDKITVTFDQPMMDGSWSWTGGGETFPEITGKIRYDSKKTICTLPVKLKAGNVYRIGINSPSHKNFKTKQRVPAKRYVIIFATKDESGNATPIPEDMLARAKKINSQSAKKDELLAENLSAEGWKLWGQRKLTEAEEKFKEAIASDPKAENAYQGLGWAQLNQGKKINAKDSFEKCVKLNPKNAAALNGLGWIAHGQDNIDEAIQWWGKAVTAQPGATASLSGLTQVYMDRKEYDKAIKYYRMWLQVEPNNEQAKEGLKKAKAANTGF